MALRSLFRRWLGKPALLSPETFRDTVHQALFTAFPATTFSPAAGNVLTGLIGHYRCTLDVRSGYSSYRKAPAQLRKIIEDYTNRVQDIHTRMDTAHRPGQGGIFP